MVSSTGIDKNITSRLLVVLASSRPIKGQARVLQRKMNKGQRTKKNMKQQSRHSGAITLVLFFLSLRLRLDALSRMLVTPTRALRCKEIQTSPPSRWT
jgi:hypothetical protein